MSPEAFFQLVVQITVLLFAVSAHESAHGLVALKFGDTTARDQGRITLNPLKHLDPFGSLFVPLILGWSGLPVFGWAKPVPVSLRDVRNPRRANLAISAAGPLSNLALAIPFAAATHLLLRVAPKGESDSLLVPLLLIAQVGTVVNVSLAAFNILPLPPLDGFGVVQSFAPAAWLPAILWLNRYGFVLLAVAMFTGLVSAVLVPLRAAVLSLLGF